MIRQGDLYWIDRGSPSGSGPGLVHPYVVIQNDVFNRSRIRTTVVCALTSNLKRARAPGNVLLEAGEGDLPKSCVVNVSQLFTVDKDDLGERIGHLPETRLREVLAGLDVLLEPRSADDL